MAECFIKQTELIPFAVFKVHLILTPFPGNVVVIPPSIYYTMTGMAEKGEQKIFLHFESLRYSFLHIGEIKKNADILLS